MLLCLGTAQAQWFYSAPGEELRFQLKHADPEGAQEVLSSLVPDAHIEIEWPATLLVQGSPGALDQLRELLAEFDRPLRLLLGKSQLRQAEVKSLGELVSLGCTTFSTWEGRPLRVLFVSRRDLGEKRPFVLPYEPARIVSIDDFYDMSSGDSVTQEFSNHSILFDESTARPLKTDQPLRISVTPRLVEEQIHLEIRVAFGRQSLLTAPICGEIVGEGGAVIMASVGGPPKSDRSSRQVLIISANLLR